MRKLCSLELSKIIEYALEKSRCRNCYEIGNYCKKRVAMLKTLRLVSTQFKRLTDAEWYKIMWCYYVNAPEVLYKFGHTNDYMDSYIVNTAIRNFNAPVLECILYYKPRVLSTISRAVQFIFDAETNIDTELLCDSIIELSTAKFIDPNTYIKFISKFLERGTKKNLINLINLLLSNGIDKSIYLLQRYCGYVNTIEGYEFYTPQTKQKNRNLFPVFEEIVDIHNQQLIKMQKLWNSGVPYISLDNIDMKSFSEAAVKGFITYNISELIIALKDNNFISRNELIRIFYKCCETGLGHELLTIINIEELIRGFNIAVKKNNYEGFAELYYYSENNMPIKDNDFINLINLSMDYRSNNIFIFLIFKRDICNINAAKNIIIKKTKYVKHICQIFINHRAPHLIPHLLLRAANNVHDFIKKRYWYAF